MQSNNNKNSINESQKVKLWITQRARKLPLSEGHSNGKSNLLQGASTPALIAGVLVSFRQAYHSRGKGETNNFSEQHANKQERC